MIIISYTESVGVCGGIDGVGSESKQECKERKRKAINGNSKVILLLV